MTEPRPSLTAEEQQQIILARRRAGKIRRAVAVARFDAWSTGFFAVMTLMYVAVSVAFGFSLIALLIGIGMAIVAYNSFCGAGELKQFNLRGPRRLGWNQLGFALMICLYCAARIVQGLLFTDEIIQPFVAYFSQMAELSGQPISTQDMATKVKIVYCAIFGAVIFVSILVQGLTAMYYFTRAGHIRAYLKQTPDWVVEILRTV